LSRVVSNILVYFVLRTISGPTQRHIRVRFSFTILVNVFFLTPRKFIASEQPFKTGEIESRERERERGSEREITTHTLAINPDDNSVVDAKEAAKAKSLVNHRL
jgi:hypothetical protein